MPKVTWLSRLRQFALRDPVDAKSYRVSVLPASESEGAEMADRILTSDADAAARYAAFLASVPEAQTQEVRQLNWIETCHPLARHLILLAAALVVGALVAWAGWAYLSAA